MVNLLNYKGSNLDMEVKEEKIPLIIKQRKFLEQLIEGNLDKARELTSLSEEERDKIARNYWQGIDFDDYLEFLGLTPAWELKDEPKDIREKIIYLSLRGIREGILQIAEINRITDPGKIARQGSTYFIRKFMDPLDKEPVDINEEIRRKIGINPIEEQIKKRLKNDPILNEYFNNKGYTLLFDAFCAGISLGISRQYDGNFSEE